MNAILNTHPLFMHEITASNEPIIALTNRLIKYAREQSASDIHLECHEQYSLVRFRQDGLLQKITELPIDLAARIITRLKILAKMDIAEKRLPQDGHFHLHDIDIRMSTCPTLFGEKIVLRLLDIHKVTLTTDKLGLTTEQHQLFLKKISAPQGFILVTGPTGSGKTVTLYSALQYLNNSEKNISTVEDPIEIQLPGINQVNINAKIGLDFAYGLKTLLRQDPDIIMVGEIRDKETAEIALQAANTGHLVLSTLHANSAIEALTRLHMMGIPQYQLLHTISLVIAQRLVRKLSLPDRTYQGRIGVFELLPVTAEVAQCILSGKDLPKQNYFVSLQEAALIKVTAGVTDIHEVQRVI